MSDVNIAADASGGNITSTSSDSAVSDSSDGGQIEIGQGGDGVGSELGLCGLSALLDVHMLCAAFR